MDNAWPYSWPKPLHMHHSNEALKSLDKAAANRVGDGWVAIYIKRQMAMAQAAFDEVYYPGNEDYFSFAKFYKEHRQDSLEYKGDLSNSVHAAKSNRQFAFDQNNYHLIDRDVWWCMS